MEENQSSGNRNPFESKCLHWDDVNDEVITTWKDNNRVWMLPRVKSKEKAVTD